MIKVPPIDELCEALKTKFEDKERRIKYLEEELEKLKDENWKDEELQDMKEKYDMICKDYYRGFPISNEEQEDIDAWIKQHEKECHPPKQTPFGKIRGGAIGGCYSYIFTPTSVGTIGTIKCNCGKKFTFQEL